MVAHLYRGRRFRRPLGLTLHAVRVCLLAVFSATAGFAAAAFRDHNPRLGSVAFAVLCLLGVHIVVITLELRA